MLFLIPQILRAEVQHLHDVRARHGIIDDLPFPSRFHHTKGAEKGKLMRDRTLELTEHQTDIAHAHLGDEERREDLHAGGVAEDGKEVRKVRHHFVLGQIILDHALVARGESDGGIHIFILTRHISSMQKRRASKKAFFYRKIRKRG